MPEYIEREALLEEARKRAKAFSSVLIYEAIKQAPTADVVKVVRCKTCRHYDYENKTCMRMSVEPEVYGEGIYVDMQENDFCSYGERKEE